MKTSPTPPAPRGRRGHKTLDEQAGLRDFLTQLFSRTPSPTLDEAMAEIATSEFTIKRTAVWNFRRAMLNDPLAVQRATLSLVQALRSDVERLTKELRDAGVIRPS